jgi:hypothetical protein
MRKRFDNVFAFGLHILNTGNYFNWHIINIEIIFGIVNTGNEHVIK